MPTPATVFISESNGAGQVVTDNITNINFGSVDQPNIVAANHPIIVGARSYFKMLRFKVQSLGDSTTIKDLRYWKSAGAYVTGEVIKIADKNVSGTIAYAQPSESDVWVLYPSGNSPIYIVDPGTAVVDIGGSLAGTLVAPGYSGYFVLQTGSSGATPVGPANTKTITFQFDET